MQPIYNKIGSRYARTRQTDPRIANQIHRELAGAKRIINIGAGTGSYEPEHADLVALEPSDKMIAQRHPESHPVVQGYAESLPFEANSFSHAMTVLSMHHWHDRPRAFRDISRITTEKFVALTWDPGADTFWLTRDYFPGFHTMDLEIFPSLDELSAYFEDVSMRPVLIPEDCQDGFLAAFWKRPEAYLDPAVQRAISTFSKTENLREPLKRLEQDLASGKWHEINSELHDMATLDAGYRLVTARIKNP